MVYEMYNLTNFTSGNATMLGLAQASNDIVNGWLGVSIIAIIAVVMTLVLGLKGYRGTDIFAGVSFGIMTLSIMLYALELISGFVLVASILMVGFAFLFLFIFKDG